MAPLELSDSEVDVIEASVIFITINLLYNNAGELVVFGQLAGHFDELTPKFCNF